MSCRWMPFYLVLISFILLYIVRNVKLLIVTINAQNAIQIIIAKNFLVGIILESGMHLRGKLLTVKIKLFALIALKIMQFIIIIVI